MPVIIYDIEKQNAIEQEPYSAFEKRFRTIEENPDGQTIDLRVGAGKEGFSKGFYTDREYFNHAALRFFFSTVKGEGTFVRMSFSYDCNRSNYPFYHRRVSLLRKRVPYFYLPFASHLEFSSQAEEEIKLQFDIIVPQKEDLKKACFCLINQVIAIHSFED